MILQNVNLENVSLVGETVDVFVAILSQWIGYASHEKCAYSASRQGNCRAWMFS